MTRPPGGTKRRRGRQPATRCTSGAAARAALYGRRVRRWMACAVRGSPIGSVHRDARATICHLRRGSSPCVSRRAADEKERIRLPHVALHHADSETRIAQLREAEPIEDLEELDDLVAHAIGTSERALHRKALAVAHGEERPMEARLLVAPAREVAAARPRPDALREAHERGLEVWREGQDLDGHGAGIGADRIPRRQPIRICGCSGPFRRNLARIAQSPPGRPTSSRRGCRTPTVRARSPCSRTALSSPVAGCPGMCGACPARSAAARGTRCESSGLPRSGTEGPA